METIRQYQTDFCLLDEERARELGILKLFQAALKHTSGPTKYREETCPTCGHTESIPIQRRPTKEELALEQAVEASWRKGGSAWQ